MKQDKRLTVAGAVTVLSAVAFAWLFTQDVYVAEPNVDGVPAFCGSAYDVALIKRDGDMGGETPTNQAAIDRACVAEATVDVVLAGAAAAVGLAAAGHAVLRLIRSSNGAETAASPPR